MIMVFFFTQQIFFLFKYFNKYFSSQVLNFSFKVLGKEPPKLCFNHKATLEKDGRNSARTLLFHLKHSKVCKESETVC